MCVQIVNHVLLIIIMPCASTNVLFFLIQPGAIEISDSDRLLSFTESYTLGVGLIKGDLKITFVG